MDHPDATAQFLGAHVDALDALTRLRLYSQTAPRMQASQRAKMATEIVQALGNRLAEHHADEEQVLFPSMFSSASSAEDRKTVSSLSSRLIVEHRRIESLWNQIRDQLHAVVNEHHDSISEADCVDLAEIYAMHVQFEETVVLPLAARLLSAQSQRAVNLTLALRHNVENLPAYI